jgi:PAS domain S-box-containing protein
MTDFPAVSILCVDDEPFFLDSFKQILQREPGFSVQTCGTGADAIEFMNTYYFDVIIADYAIPDIDGISLLKDVRARGYVGLFIIVTGKHRAHIAIDALNNGANYYFQKSGEAVQDIPQLVEFIRKGVGKGQAGSAQPDNDTKYRSIIDNHPDLLCRFRPDGTITFVNDAYWHFMGIPRDTCIGSNFLSVIPQNERKTVETQLHALSPVKPGVVVEHPIIKGNGSTPRLQWNYRAVFNAGGTIAEYQTSGRDISSLIQHTVVPEVEKKSAVPADPVPSVTSPSPISSDEWRSLAETIKTLENPVFAIDRQGVVIAWNAAMEQLTGVNEKAMLGKGNYEYAVPFYGNARPMLIDYLITPADKVQPGKFPAIKKVGDTFIGEMEHVEILGKSMFLWGKGTAVHNANGELIAAIQAITVGEQQVASGSLEQETYIGGISSLTLKVAGEGMGGAIAGALGSTTGGYGVYATDRRLFVIQNPDLDVKKPQGVQFSAFMMDELFGTTVDTHPKTIQELEKFKIFESDKKEITALELKKPVLLSGYLTINTGKAPAFRVYIDHKKAYQHLEQLMKTFSPEVLRLE